MLLVNDHESEARKRDRLLNDGVRADDRVDFSGGYVPVQPLLLGRLERAYE